MFKTLLQPTPVRHHTGMTTEMQSMHHDLPDTHMLKLEAEKIRNWQVQTEMNTKQMEKVVQNLRMTVESQRKSLLEVQLEYENVGNKMQEEINKRALCLQKIESTRDICSLLKTQACDLEKTLHFCDELKDDLESKHDKHFLLIQKLSVDFEELVQVNEEAKENYLCKITSREKKFDEEKTTLLQELEMQKNKVSRYLQNLDHDELVIDMQTSCLLKIKKRLEEEIASNRELTTSNERLLSDVKLLTLDNTLLKSAVEDQKTLRKRTENDLNDVCDKLESSKTERNNLQEKIDHQVCEINDQRSKLYEFNECLSDKIACVSRLEKQLKEKDENLEVCTKDLKFVSCASNDLKEQISQLLEFKKKMVEELAQREVIIASSNDLISQNKALIEQLQDEITCLKKANEEVEKAIDFSRQENKGMKTKAEEMANESRKLQHQLETARFTVEESQKKIDFYQKNQSTLQIELNKEISKNDNMKKEIEELKKLEGNADLLRSLQAEFEKQGKRLHDIEQNVVEVTTTLQNKEKLLKECQENLDKSNDTVEQLTKSLNATKHLYNELVIIRNDQTTELDNLYKDLQKSKDLLSEEQQKHQNAVENLEEVHQKQVQVLNRKIQSLNDKLEIQKEERARKKEKKSYELPVKKVKSGNFSPLYGHDASVSGRDYSALSVLPLMMEKHMLSKQTPRHSSTPIQKRQNPSRFVGSSKKIRSKNFWKRATPKVISKPPSNPKKKNGEENWFDTDSVYGFFE